MGKNASSDDNYMDYVFSPREDLIFNVDEDGNVVVDMENTGFFNTLAQKLFKKPRISHIKLDAIGSKLWLLMDNRSSVYDIALKMEEEFPGEGDMTSRVVVFFKRLEKLGWIVRG